MAVLGLAWPVLGITLWSAICCLYFHYLEVRQADAKPSMPP